MKPIEEARLKHDSVSGQRRRGAGYATKIHGELAELAFLFKAASLGIAVAKPYGDSLPYDFMCNADSGSCAFRSSRFSPTALEITAIRTRSPFPAARCADG